VYKAYLCLYVCSIHALRFVTLHYVLRCYSIGDAVIRGLHGEQSLSQYDSAELFGPNKLSFNNAIITKSPSDLKLHMLIVEMAYTGVGRTDL